MEDELNLDDLDQVQTNAENKLKVKNRFEQLSEKVIITSKEREEAQARAQAEAEARAQAEKERDFYKGFSQNISKYPQASEYQEQILEKVKGGYSTEDAMVAVLAKEGKLNMSYEAPQAPSQPVEGGSAPTVFSGNKTLENMSADEKFAALQEMDKSGDLSDLLRGK